MVFDLQMIGIVIVFVWLSVISIFVWKVFSQINKIFDGEKDQSITAALHKLVKDSLVAEKDIKNLLGRVNALEEHTQNHIQKIGLVRFNPFQDTGGDQSFILALIDKKNTGIIISGLYARSGMRWYVKRVINGKGEEHELSDEEKKVIETAK